MMPFQSHYNQHRLSKMKPFSFLVAVLVFHLGSDIVFDFVIVFVASDNEVKKSVLVFTNRLGTSEKINGNRETLKFVVFVQTVWNLSTLLIEQSQFTSHINSSQLTKIFMKLVWLIFNQPNETTKMLPLLKRKNQQ